MSWGEGGVGDPLVEGTFDGFVSPVAVWERPARAPSDWKVPREQVDDAIADAMEHYEVLELVVDPPGWASEIDGWSEAYDVVLEFPTNSRARMIPACDRFRADVLEGGLSHDGSPVLARHIGHAVARHTSAGTIVTKAHPDSPRKIDAAIAAIIAYNRAMWHAANEIDVDYVIDTRPLAAELGERSRTVTVIQSGVP